MQDYSILKPRNGYVILKEIEDDEKKVLVKSGQSESRAIGKIIALPPTPQFDFFGSKLKLDDLVVYNEYEGQELFKWGPIDEDNIIVIKEENILMRIDYVQPISQESKERDTTETK